MSERVVVTGLGVVSSLGIGKDTFWKALIKGESGISPVEAIDTSQHATHNGGEVKNFDPHEFMSDAVIRRTNRSTQFAVAASRLAVGDADLSPHDLGKRNVGVCLGTTTGSMQEIEGIDDRLIKGGSPTEDQWYRLQTHTASSFVASELGATGPNVMFATACAAGNYAIGYGYDLIRLGRADVVIAGGADPFSRISFTGFNQFSAVAPEKCQPFDLNRKGMMVAEGAGILVLERLSNALQRKASIYAEVLGYGLSCDAKHMTNPSVEGVSQCMKKAMRESGISSSDVDYISAHGTGTPTNDKVECAAIARVFSDEYKSIPISSIKSMIGHTMGAASALEAVTCVLALKHGMIPPTINYETPDPECDINCVPNRARDAHLNIVLNNSYAFGGNNASLALRKFNEQEDI